MTADTEGAPIVPLEYRGVREAEGPLVVVEGLEGVGFDEFAAVRLGDQYCRRDA